jgi:hypothetical protein
VSRIPSYEVSQPHGGWMHLSDGEVAEATQLQARHAIRFGVWAQVWTLVNDPMTNEMVDRPI